MTGMEILLAIVLGLIVNEMSDVSPWAARKMVRWSAQVRYGDTPRREIRAEELAAVIDERPGKLFKLGTATRFLSAALAARARRVISGDSGEVELTGRGRRVTWEEASTLVARYLFPTEKYRGEWRRHWIDVFKSICTGLGIAGLAVWATLLRIKPRYASWIVAGIIVYTVLWIGYRCLRWYLQRFVITNKRLVFTEGVFTRRVRMLPLLRVTDMNYDQSMLGRVLNYGTFHVDGVSRWNSLRRIRHLPNPNELYLRLVEEMYEPEAVEARLRNVSDEEYGDFAGAEFDQLPYPEFIDEDELRQLYGQLAPRPALSEVERLEVQVNLLKARLAAVTVALARLTPPPAPDVELESGVTEPETPDPVR
jgi:membrane protein YdbS with pleckstrin-like domain